MAGKSLNEEDSRYMEFEAIMAIYEDQLLVTMGEDNSLCYKVELENVGAVLTLHLSDKYPEVSPSIKVVNSTSIHLVELENHLTSLSNNMHGEVIIYNLIEEAKKWAEENKTTMTTTSENTQHYADSVCSFFLEGKCKFGDKCRKIHPANNSEMSSDQQSVTESCDISDKPGCVVEQEVIKSSKKPSMKTACDVISRVQWDDKIDAAKFTIGFLDRFIGIIERPFDDFSWVDIASVDYDVLSIPRHRIQYFKYCNEIVWDKRERLDNVFGSTGSGVTIYDVVNRKMLDKTDEISPVEEEEEISQNFQNDFETEDSSAGNEGGRIKKDNVPNYFLAFKVHDKEILDNVDKLQQYIVSSDSNMANGLNTSQSLHITLLMLTIRTDEELTLVKDIVKGIQHTLPSLVPPSKTLKYSNVGTFKDRVVYISLEKDQGLQKWVQVLTSKLRENGINLGGNRDSFTPHLTVARLPTNSRSSSLERRRICSKVEASYDGVVFGRQRVNNVGLYSRFDQKDADGFYHEVFHIENSFFAVLPSLKNKVVDYLVNAQSLDVKLRDGVVSLLEVDSASDEALCLLSTEQQRQQQGPEQLGQQQQREQRQQEQQQQQQQGPQPQREQEQQQQEQQQQEQQQGQQPQPQRVQRRRHQKQEQQQQEQHQQEQLQQEQQKQQQRGQEREQRQQEQQQQQQQQQGQQPHPQPQREQRRRQRERQEQQQQKQQERQRQEEQQQQQHEQQQQQHCGRLVVILRGIPGCGKTYLLENSLESKQGLSICSPKQLFHRAGNASTIDQSDNNIAEAYCRNAFLEALASNISTIAIDSCHSQLWQYSIYQKIAAVFGVPVKVVQISCRDRDSVLKCHKYSSESVEDLLSLVEGWEDDIDAVCIQPWFSEPSNQEYGDISIRKLANA